MTARIKAGLFFSFPLLVLCLSILFPKESIDGVRHGAALCAGPLLSLFPSLILSRMMIHTQPQALNGKKMLFVSFFLGILCGFPIGAIHLASLTEQKRIQKQTAEKMLFFTGTASPAFLVSYCGRVLFGNAWIGWYFFFMQVLLYFFSFIVFLITQKDISAEKTSFSPPPSFFQALTLSIKEAALTYLHLISCVIFFSFFSELVCRILGASNLLSALFSAFFELSGGVDKISVLPTKTALPLAGAALGWNGLSVHFQTLGALEKEEIGVRYYFFGKIFFALLFFAITYFLQKLL